MDEKKKYVAGLDFGTLSCRCLIVDPANGREVAEETCDYAHGVMEEKLPTGVALPENFCLQHPGDYLEAMGKSICGAVKKAEISPEDITGIGLDFTSCTILPVKEDMTPLCFLPAMEHDPHAWVKLWKHHGALDEAEEITKLAKERDEVWLSSCGGVMSAECALPKILETLRKAPEVYKETDRFIEAGDWVASMLTGKEVHSAIFAGFKLQWDKEEGYYSNEFLTQLDPEFDGIVGTKLSGRIQSVFQKAGGLSAYGASLTGLMEGTAVAMPVIDAHAGMPGCGALHEGDMMMVLGTSACHMLHGKTKKDMPGLFGRACDTVVPGLYTYEAGQSAVGDLLNWFVTNSIPGSYEDEAKAGGISVFTLLTDKAAELRPTENSPVGLDWVGGNRTPLNDSSLPGVMTGLRLSTTPEEQYRAWIEALAFGTRKIFETYEESGLRIGRILVSGGIAKKNPLMMQIYADVSGRKLEVVVSKQAAALGSAIYAAAAAGLWKDVPEAVEKMHSPVERVYEPDEAAAKVYDRLYQKYQKLFVWFKEGF